jgi:type II secretory pathway pseudopilin PulG
MSFLARTESSPQRPQNSGFALIITIVLMSMLVLLMVSMASLTRVETQIASNYQQVDQARSNALMALNIAIGELQAEAGPDQRITARADILDSDADTEVIDTVNQPYWTGVWKTGDKSPDVANSGPTQRVLTFGLASPTLADKSKTAKWLVSNPTPSIRVDPITGWTGDQPLGCFGFIRKRGACG